MTCRQVYDGAEIGGFVVGESVRRASGLFWKCACSAGHATEIPSHMLMYGTPRCDQCTALASAKAKGHGESAGQMAEWMRRHHVPRRKEEACPNQN
jgi:hypothetical protein